MSSGKTKTSCPQKSSKGVLTRYTRQMLLGNIGFHGQVKIKNARVLVIGAGGIGSSVLMSLAGMGVGCIGIVENDVVEKSNLHRQTIHTVKNIGISKARSAKDFIEALNPCCNVVLHDTRINQTNAIGLVSQYDIVIDGCDNATTRYIVNDACVLTKVR
jgi:molybdopterin/thiamine biosynthesis adenylyltransferase